MPPSINHGATCKCRTAKHGVLLLHPKQVRHSMVIIEHALFPPSEWPVALNADLSRQVGLQNTPRHAATMFERTKRSKYGMRLIVAAFSCFTFQLQAKNRNACDGPSQSSQIYSLVAMASVLLLCPGDARIESAIKANVVADLLFTAARRV